MIKSISRSFIFDRQLLRQRRSRLSVTAVTHSRLSQYLQSQLVERLQLVKRNFSTILVLGDLDVSSLFPQASLWQFSLTGSEASVCFDDEFLPFGQAKFDLIISFMEMHCFNDIPGFLQQIKYCLAADGLFLSVFLGQDTLWQLRQATQLVEDNVYGGISPRVVPMVKLSDAAALMQRAGFSLPVVDIDQIEMIYSNTQAFLQDLKAMGLSNTMLERSKRVGEKSFLRRLIQFYDQHYGGQSGVMASFTAIYMSGWGVSDHQPKALKPGSATALLADYI